MIHAYHKNTKENSGGARGHCESTPHGVARGAQERGRPISYETWIAGKSAVARFDGIDGVDLAQHLFPHQADLVRWALRRGRSAIFADTGLGKTAIQIEWARHVSARGRVLILAPLAVAQQSVREAARWGVSVEYTRSDAGAPITITNYEMLERFDPSQFAGIVLDESSILKSHDGATRSLVIESFARTPYRLACTATPAPNDHAELGNHAEFLGIKTRTEMLAEYFVHDGETTQEWRIKGHAVASFWRWVCSWGAIVRKPGDLGHSNDGFDLPPLRVHEEIIGANHRDTWATGSLFAGPAMSLSEQRAVRRNTMADRVEIAARIASEDGPTLIWCELNDEGDALEAAIPGSVQVRGADSPESKEDRLLGFADGKYRVLVTKPSIAGHGMNWQHCARVVFVGASHSYEQTYQAIRRCWRFGQKRPVDVHVIRSELDDAIMRNYKRKDDSASVMAQEIAPLIAESLREIRGATSREWNDYSPTKRMTIPAWVSSEGP